MSVQFMYSRTKHIDSHYITYKLYGSEAYGSNNFPFCHKFSTESCFIFLEVVPLFLGGATIFSWRCYHSFLEVFPIFLGGATILSWRCYHSFLEVFPFFLGGAPILGLHGEMRWFLYLFMHRRVSMAIFWNKLINDNLRRYFYETIN